MPASKQLRVLSVRLPESDVRRFKSLAASRGVSLQEAVQQALESWISLVPKANPEPLEALQSSLTDVDVEKIMRADKESELAKDQRWS